MSLVILGLSSFLFHCINLLIPILYESTMFSIVSIHSCAAFCFHFFNSSIFFLYTFPKFYQFVYISYYYSTIFSLSSSVSVLFVFFHSGDCFILECFGLCVFYYYYSLQIHDKTFVHDFYLPYGTILPEDEFCSKILLLFAFVLEYLCINYVVVYFLLFITK